MNEFSKQDSAKADKTTVLNQFSHGLANAQNN